MSFELKALIAMFLSFLLSSILGPRMIPLLKRLKIGQSIREDGPQSHLAKTGTPTMGGLVFIVSSLLIFVLLGNKSINGIVILLSMLGFGAIGYLDDYIKVVKKRNLGLRAYQKIIGQIIVAILLIIYFQTSIPNPEVAILPLIGGVNLNLGIWIVPFLLIVVLGTVNAVNLTDGLDGLATGISIIVFASFSFISYRMEQFDISLVSIIIAGSLMGFLIINYNPAKVFMGDTGSLALGGALSAVAILSRTYLFIPIIGGVFFAEALSVIIQVFYFKTTGKRFFKMAPLHHHFEQIGWKEIKVVWSFWAVTLLLAIIGIVTIL
ncbi:MAG: phospho-N-acetylmuramoyl-pentapeptide-transferase [Gudongella sp.]|nr:phospho-N-acetylmuramoyl-pentapeptide-transferase [Gudongella sp.]